MGLAEHQEHPCGSYVELAVFALPGCRRTWAWVAANSASVLAFCRRYLFVVMSAFARDANQVPLMWQRIALELSCWDGYAGVGGVRLQLS